MPLNTKPTSQAATSREKVVRLRCLRPFTSRMHIPCKCLLQGKQSAAQLAELKFGSGTFDLVYRPSPGRSETLAREVSPLQQLGRCLPLFWPLLVVIANWAYSWGPSASSPVLQALLCGLGPILMHAVLPAIDAMIGPREHHVEALSFAPALTIALHLMAMVGTYAHVATAPVAPLQLYLLMYTCVISLLPCFSAAHGLQHQANSGINHFLATAAMSHSLLVPYLITHSAQHHLGVGMTGDSETVSLSENVYTGGLARCFVSQYTVGARVAADECRRKGWAVWSLKNKFIKGLLFQAAHIAAVATLFGPVALALHLGIALYGILYWSVVFLTLHHGLDTRAPGPTAKGSRIPVRVDHSWNSAYVLENLLLFNLLCHSHHHVAGASFSEKLLQGAPLWPAPILALSATALVPPLWSALMEDRIKAVVAMQGEDLQRS